LGRGATIAIEMVKDECVMGFSTKSMYLLMVDLPLSALWDERVDKAEREWL
jgi:hypothetical protein